MTELTLVPTEQETTRSVDHEITHLICCLSRSEDARTLCGYDGPGKFTMENVAVCLQCLLVEKRDPTFCPDLGRCVYQDDDDCA